MGLLVLIFYHNYGRVTEQLFNCIHDNDDVTYTNDIFVTVDEIELVIGHLNKKKKSCGLDGVNAEH